MALLMWDPCAMMVNKIRERPLDSGYFDNLNNWFSNKYKKNKNKKIL
jgi:hypothetical protein